MTAVRSALASIALLMTLLIAAPAAAQNYSRVDDLYSNRMQDARLAQVIQINPVEIERRGGNTGTLIGALVGGLAGRQVGHGSARDVATGVGALLGGHAGTRVQRRGGRQIAYEVFIQDMSYRNGRVTSTIQPDMGLNPGDYVFVSGYDRNATLSLASPEAAQHLLRGNPY